MNKYIKKSGPADKQDPVEVAQWFGKFAKDAKAFVQAHGMPNFKIGTLNGIKGLIIPTEEGDQVAARGDFVVKGETGEYYPCSRDVFKTTFTKIR